MKSLLHLALFLSFLMSTCLAEPTKVVVVTVKNQSGEPIYIVLGKDDQSEKAGLAARKAADRGKL